MSPHHSTSLRQDKYMHPQILILGAWYFWINIQRELHLLIFEGNTGIQNAKELHTDPASNGPAQAHKHARILSRGAKQYQAK